MDTLLTAAATLGFLITFLALGAWVFVALALVAVSALFFLHGMDLSRIGSIASGIFYRYATSWELSAIPMFIWMGEIIFRTDISTRLFRGLSPFVDYILDGCFTPTSWAARCLPRYPVPRQRPRPQWAGSPRPNWAGVAMTNGCR